MNIVWEQRKRNIEHSIRRARRFFPYKKAAVFTIVLAIVITVWVTFANMPTVLSNVVGHPVSVEWEGDPIAPLEDMLGWDVTKSFPGSLPTREADVAVFIYKNGSAKKATFYKNSQFVDISGQIYTYNPNSSDDLLHKLARALP